MLLTAVALLSYLKSSVCLHPLQTVTCVFRFSLEFSESGNLLTGYNKLWNKSTNRINFVRVLRRLGSKTAVAPQSPSMQFHLLQLTHGIRSKSLSEHIRGIVYKPITLRKQSRIMHFFLQIVLSILGAI